MKPFLPQVELFFICLFFFVLPFERRHIFFSLGYQFGDFSAISLYFSDLIVLCLFLLSILKFRGYFTRGVEFYWPFFGVIALALIGFFISPRGNFNYFSLIKWAELAFVLIYFSFYVGQSVARAILMSISASGLLQALIAIGQFVKQGSLGLKTFGETVISPDLSGIAKIDTSLGKVIRAYGTFAHPNQLAAFLVVACATTIILLFMHNFGQNTKKFYIATLFLIVIGEILTFSRAGWAAALLATIMIFWFSRGTMGKEQIYKQTRITILTALVAGVIILLPFIGPRLKINDASNISRAYYDRIGLQIFAQHPIFGVGLGQMMPAAAQLEKVSEAWQLQPPHNYLIAVACETGLIGLLIILGIFWNMLMQLWKKLKTGDQHQVLFKIFLFSTLISIFLLMQFDHYFYTLQQTQLLLWSMLGIINGAIYSS